MYAVAWSILFRIKTVKSARPLGILPERLRNIETPIIRRTFRESVAERFLLSKVLFPNLVSKNSDK